MTDLPAASHREAVAQAIRCELWEGHGVDPGDDALTAAADAVLVVTEAAKAVAVRDAVADALRGVTTRIKALRNGAIDGDQGPLYGGGYENALHDALAAVGAEQAHGEQATREAT